MKDTDRLELKIRWIALIVILTLPVLTVFILLYAAFIDFLKGDFSTVESLIFLLLILTSLYLIAAILNEVTITIDRQEICKRFLFWKKSIRWEDIVAANTTLLAGNPWKVTVNSANKTIMINLFFFKNATIMLRTIENKLPEHIGRDFSL